MTNTPAGTGAGTGADFPQRVTVSTPEELVLVTRLLVVVRECRRRGINLNHQPIELILQGRDAAARLHLHLGSSAQPGAAFLTGRSELE